ncbi:pyrroline-5-carboxylate reductase [Orbaceae bacterium ac157xtp]
MEQRIGFIGLGNMGSAILEGILQSGNVPASQFYVYDVNTEVTDTIKQQYDVNVCESAKEIAKQSDIVFVAVKPINFSEVSNDIQKELKKSTVVVSIVAGYNIKMIEALIGYEQKIIRVMPNTPALIDEGMSALTPNTEVTPEELNIVRTLLNSTGRTEVIPEYQMHAATGVSGSSPAFVFMFIEALADGAVKAGMPRKQAYKFAAQTVMGSAKLVLETGKHPAELKDKVCSPNGTTIDGVQALEDAGFRSAVMKAVEASVARSKALCGEK